MGSYNTGGKNVKNILSFLSILNDMKLRISSKKKTRGNNPTNKIKQHAPEQPMGQIRNHRVIKIF